MDGNPGFTSPNIKESDLVGFQQDVLLRSREVPVLVDFWAEWCGPCKALSPLLERVTFAAEGAFDLVKIDVDANQELAQQFGVQSIPTVVAIKNGKEVDRFMGALPEQQLLAFIQGILPTELDLMVDQARTAFVEGDTEGAEHILRQVIEQKPDHQDAGTSLAAMLIDDGAVEEALIVLGRLVPDAEVERLQAAARLRESSTDEIAGLEAAANADGADDDAPVSYTHLRAHETF